MIRLDDNREADETLVTHAEYQVFLDEMRAQGRYYQPDHWWSYQFPVGQGRAATVGVRPSDAVAFCEWLTSKLGDGWRYRIPYSGELSTIPMPALASDAGYWTESTGTYRIESHRSMLMNDAAMAYIDNAIGRDYASAKKHVIDAVNVYADDVDMSPLHATAIARDRVRRLDSQIAYVRVLVIQHAGELDDARTLGSARGGSLDLITASLRALTEEDWDA